MRRIALIKPSALGDIVHALPVLGALRRRWPAAHITWVVNRAFEPLLAGHPDLDATLAFDRETFRGGVGHSLRYAWQFAQRLRRERFDLVIDLQGLLRTGLMCAATGSPRRVGFANAREGARRFYTECVNVPDADRIHAVDRYWRIAEYLKAGSGPLEFRVPVSSQIVAAMRDRLKALPRPWLAVAVGAKWVTKRWPPESFANLLVRAQTQHGGTVLFVGSRDDRSASSQTAKQLPGAWCDYTGATTLPQLAALLSLADVMIANDTGPLHLAAALGVPCVAPYTCTKASLHGPYRQAGGVETQVACGGSYFKQCPHQFECRAELTADRLWPSLDSVLLQYRTRAA